MGKLKTKKYHTAKKGGGLKAALYRHLEITKRENEERLKEEKQLKIKEAQVKKANQPKRQKKGKFDNDGDKEVTAEEEDGRSAEEIKAAEEEEIKKAFIPFKRDDVVLFVGEGDFSYALSCVQAKYIKAKNVIATSYDSFEEAKKKYPDSEKNIQELQSQGAKVLHEIDATDLVKSLGLQVNKFGKHKFKNRFTLNGHDLINLIQFNFPHIGGSESNQMRSIKQHQDLLTRFFKSCQMVFKALDDNARYNNVSAPHQHITGYSFNYKNSGGDDDDDEDVKQISEYNRIGLSLFEGEPYESWTIKILARKSINYQVERSGKVVWAAYPGYHHRRTAGMGITAKEQSSRPARTYTFKLFEDKKPKKDEDGYGSD